MKSRADQAQPRLWWLALLCAVAGAVVFQWFGNATHGYIQTDSLFWWWVFQWINPDSETEHGWLILGIAAWLAWRNLRRADRGGRSAERRDSPNQLGADQESSIEMARPAGPLQSALRHPHSAMVAPAAALLGGLALHAVGFAAQQARVSILGLLLFAWGVVRLGGGRRWGAATAFPIAFLVFAIPFNALDTVGFWLRLWVIKASTGIAHAAHIGVIQNGTQLLAPDGRYNYDVAAACSGIRSLMALAALSLVIGYLNFQATWRRGVTFALCFPLVYVGNVARITAIIFAAQAGGEKWGGRAHDVMGWAIFVIVLGGVLAGAALLRRLAGETEGREVVPRRPGFPAPNPDVTEASTPGDALPVRALLVAAVVVGAALGEIAFLRHLAHLPPRGQVGVRLAADDKNPVELPTYLGREWVGLPAAVTAFERQILPPDTGYSRMDYVATRDRQHVFLSIVLSGRDRSSIHRPELCLVGQGWTVEGRQPYRFAYPDRSGKTFPASILRVLRRPSPLTGGKARPELVAYWFVSGDEIVATHWGRLSHDAWNRVVHGRADRWAYVLVQADASDGEAAALERMQSVLNAALPAFQRAP